MRGRAGAGPDYAGRRGRADGLPSARQSRRRLTPEPARQAAPYIYPVWVPRRAGKRSAAGPLDPAAPERQPPDGYSFGVTLKLPFLATSISAFRKPAL